MRKIVVLRDAGYLFSSDAVIIAIGLIGQIILTHSLSTIEYGSWVIAIDLLGILFLLVHFGIPDVLGRDVPRFGEKIVGILRFYTTFQLTTALFIAPVGVAILLNLLSPELSLITVIFLSISVACQILGATFRMILRSLGEARTEGLLRVLDRGSVVAGYLINASILENSIEGFAISTAIGPIITLPLSFLKSKKILLGASADGSELLDMSISRKNLLLQSLPFVLTSGLLLVINRVDKIVLMYFTGPEAVAVFNVGWLCYFAGCSVPQAFMSILLPEFGSIRGNSELIRDTTRNSYSILEWFIPPGIFVGSLVSFYGVPLLFPDEYTSWSQQFGGSAVAVFFVLLSAWVMVTLAAPFFTNIQAGENPWVYTAMGLVMIIVDVVSAIILVPSYGIIGAAWATVATRTATLAFLFLYSGGFSLYPVIGKRILVIGAISLFFSISSTMSLDGTIPLEALAYMILTISVGSVLIGWRPSYMFERMRETRQS
jgi:O-antigen/teichoic acid export membrane protein